MHAAPAASAVAPFCFAITCNGLSLGIVSRSRGKYSHALRSRLGKGARRPNFWNSLPRATDTILRAPSFSTPRPLRQLAGGPTASSIRHPKDFATCSKANGRRNWRPQCFRVPQLGVSSREGAEGRSNLGWANNGPPGSWDLGGPSQGRNCSHPNGTNHPEQASALVEKGRTLGE